MPHEPNYESVGLPVRAFLYTLDQIATLLDMTQENLEAKHIFFEGRSAGSKRAAEMRAINLAPNGDKPDWRVQDAEFIRWLRHRGIRIYTRGYGVN